MSVVQKPLDSKPSLSEAGVLGLNEGANAFVPHTVFTVGAGGSVQMSPYTPLSLDGQLEDTHNEIIKMQNSMIDHKKQKLIEKGTPGLNL